MLSTKFALAPSLVGNGALPELFDEQTRQAEAHYTSGNVIISGTPPAWSTVEDALTPWRRLLV